MELKSILKSLKLNESTISMLLGLAVVVVVGLIVVNYFRNLETGTTLPTGVNTEQAGEVDLPTTHTVTEGETLWDIAEVYYDSGYNWTDVQEANDLTDPSDIETGQELIIPDVPVKLATVENTEEPDSELAMANEEPEAETTSEPNATSEPTVEPTASPEVKSDETDIQEEVAVDNEVEGDTYTVVRGDNLWDIAVRAYGSGYEWVNIAEANDLVNPGVIHAGNVLTLPR